MEYTLCMAILTPSYYIKKDFKAGCRLIEQKLYIDAIFSSNPYLEYLCV